MNKPERHEKGWGYELWISNTEKYCGKILHFNKRKRCSVHYHEIKDETFYLLSGQLELLLSDSPEEYKKENTSKVIMNPRDTIRIWPKRVHQMIALEESELIEISTQHFEEDSYRLVKGD